MNKKEIEEEITRLDMDHDDLTSEEYDIKRKELIDEF